MKKEIFKNRNNFRNSLLSPFDNFLDNFYWNEDVLLNDETELHPRCNLIEDEKNYYLDIDLPGIKKEDIKIDLLGDNSIRIQGEKKSEREKEGLMRHYAERKYGFFSREFSLPNNFKKEAIEADYQNGVLCLVLPKLSEEKVQRIAIK
jgi:HSP20 family protein